MATVTEIFEKMRSAFDKKAAAGMNAVYQFDITGDNGGKYYAKIVEGELIASGAGEQENPNITIRMADQHFIDLIEGRLSGQMAYMTGKIKITGDMSLAMKMGAIFKA